MAKALDNVATFISTDKDGTPNGAMITYDVVDGLAADRGKSHQVSAPDFNKTFHNTGAVGEFYRDEIDLIKTAEGIS